MESIDAPAYKRMPGAGNSCIQFHKDSKTCFGQIQHFIAMKSSDVHETLFASVKLIMSFSDIGPIVGIFFVVQETELKV